MQLIGEFGVFVVNCIYVYNFMKLEQCNALFYCDLQA